MPYDYAPCYRLAPAGRLESIPVRGLDIRFGTDVIAVCERLKYERAPCIELGNTRESGEFRVEVHERYTEPDEADKAVADCRFMVGIVVASFFEWVFVEGLPDLLPFLAQLAPIGQASLMTYQEQLREFFAEDEENEEER